jgi:hypothetical protein
LSHLKLYLQRDSHLHTGVLYYLSCWHCKRGLRSAMPISSASYKPAVSIGGTYECR